METILTTTLIGLFFGTFGTTIGGIIGICVKSTSKKVLSFILEFAAGLMIAIICFELIPEAMEISSIGNIIIGILFGIVAMIFCDNIIKKRYEKKEKNKAGNSLLKTGIIVGIRLSIT